ncbi:MAG: ABC transporter permease [Janthinobacterium lividum]
MHNIWLIAKREYLERIRTKGFLVATILIPLLMGGFVFGAGYMGSNAKSDSHIAIVTSDVAFGNDLQRELHAGKDSRMNAELVTVSSSGSLADATTAQTRRMKKKQIDGFLVEQPAVVGGDRQHFTWFGHAADISTKSTVTGAIRTVQLREGLIHNGMDATRADRLMTPVEVEEGNNGDTRTAFYAAYLLFFLMYMVIMLYGMNVARSIIEEKTSRVFEVLLATVKPDQVLAGKILGVGSVGITQILIWLAAGITLGSSQLVAAKLGGHAALSISPVQAIFFVLYFIFGFLMYSSIAAALGAMTNSEQELQQLNMFLVLPLAACMLMLPVIIVNPNSTLSRVVSLIPFCTPLLMNFRVSLAMPSPLEIGASFVLMSLTILAIIWISSRIYRVGILMYGKKPNLPEIMRWLKYS